MIEGFACCLSSGMAQLAQLIYFAKVLAYKKKIKYLAFSTKNSLRDSSYFELWAEKASRYCWRGQYPQPISDQCVES